MEWEKRWRKRVMECEAGSEVENGLEREVNTVVHDKVCCSNEINMHWCSL